MLNLCKTLRKLRPHRTATKDLVTGSVTYDDWDGAKASVYRHTALGARVDQVAGYTAHIPTYRSTEKTNDGNDMFYVGPREAGVGAHSQDVNIDFINGNDNAKYKTMPDSQDFYITYTANPQSIKYTFVDDDNNGQEVLTTTVNGVTDQTVNTNLALPTNYVLALNNTVPSTVKLGAINNPVVIHVKHKTNNTYDFDTANRDIIVNLPNGIKHEYWQKIGFRRTKTVDLVTNQTAYGDWNVFDQTSAWRIDQTWQESKSYIIKNGAVRFAPINLPKVPGYRPILKWLNSNAMQINLVKD